MFVVCGQPVGHEGAWHGCGHMLTTDWTTVHPCGHIFGGHGVGHVAGAVAVVVGQNAGQLGGWQGCGQDGIRQFAGQVGGRQGDGHGCGGGGICWANLLGEK